jgi:ubiquinol-cytochrome c reductase cytochrome c subunit
MRRRRLLIGLCALCTLGALASLAASRSRGAQAPPIGSHPPLVPGATGSVARGRALFETGCSSCHGVNAEGIPRRGPSLHGVGALAADFELSTGRMPLDAPGDQPLRHKPTYKRRDIDDLIAYVASFGGPPIPHVDPSKGRIAAGLQLFDDHCAGCHQIVGQGGMATGARIPALQHATPTEIAEAIRLGPYLMPKFSHSDVSQEDINSLVRYIAYTRAPYDHGGWGIGHLGPIPEGMVTWLLAIVALVLAIRLIGERTTE